MQELQTAANEVLEKKYLAVANQKEPDLSSLDGKNGINQTELIGYILYQSKNRTNTLANIIKAIKQRPQNVLINPAVSQHFLKKLEKQGYALDLDNEGIAYELAANGTQWVEKSVLPKLGHGGFTPEINKAILWQKDEVPLAQVKGKELFEDITVSSGTRVGHDGFLVVTNQRLLFAHKFGRLSTEYAIMYGINLENIVNVSHGRFGFNDRLVILDSNNQHRNFVEPNIQNIIPTINAAIIKRRNQIMSEKQKEQIQIVLDFSSLKEVMAKGGLVMTTYKCPNCNGMVKLPEDGKVLICEYCGSPIKPVDIFEKIKSLIQ